MNSNVLGLDWQVVHTHRTSCRGCWPRGFGALNFSPHYWIFTSVPKRFQSSLIHFSYGPNTCSSGTKVWRRASMSNRWRSTQMSSCSTIGAAQLSFRYRNRTEITALTVNKSLIQYGFRASTRAIRYTVNIVWGPIKIRWSRSVACFKPT